MCVLSSLRLTQILQALFLGLVFLYHLFHTSFTLLPPSITITITIFSLFTYSIYHFILKPYPIMLLNYSCYKPPNDRKSSYELSEHLVHKSRRFSPTSIEFMRKIYLKSGLGDETYAPPYVFQGRNLDEATLECAWEEAKQGMFSAVDSLLSSTHGIDPRVDIDILIVTCGSFSPSPSLTSLLVNHYKMQPTVRTFNLSGMGCGSGILAIDMAAHLLRAGGRKVQNALVVMTENISLNWYFGNDRSMLVTNCIFRVGCAACLVTNDPTRTRSAKFELTHSLRTHHGSDDSSYKAAFQEEDTEGNTGISLTKDLVRVAGLNLRAHITTLAPRVLPLSQLGQYAYSVVLSVLTRGESSSKPIMVPDFTTAFEHMCIHTGGKAVIEQVGKVLRLSEWDTEPARMTLHRFGNTSSSMVLYELAYFEAKKRVKKGDRVWMLGFGTGFKVGSLVFKAIRDSGYETCNPWNDCIHRYPLKSW